MIIPKANAYLLSLLTLCVLAGCGRYVNPEDRLVYERLERLGGEMDLNPEGRIASIELSRTAVTDDDLRLLQGLNYVWCVSLYDTTVTDRAMEHVAGLGNLKWLDVQNTNVTREGLLHLTGLKKLITVWIGDTGITDDDIRQLREKMPTTEFRR